MYNARAYGIVAGETRVTVHGKDGEVLSSVHDRIRVKFGDAIRQLNLLDVLRFASPGQGFVKLEADRRKLVLFLCSCLGLVNVHVANFIDVDARMKKKRICT